MSHRCSGIATIVNAQRGVTIVEFMVSIAIAIFIISGVIQVFVSGKKSFLEQQEVAFIQENARYAIDQLEKDIRMAGYFGCNDSGNLTNSLNDSSDSDNWWLSSNGIKGFDDSQASSDFPDAYKDDRETGTDSFVINRGEMDNSVVVVSHNPKSATIKLNDASKRVNDEILVIASPNCLNMAIFQVSNTNASGKDEGINHNKGNGSPGNCAKDLTGYKNCAAWDKDVEGGEYPPGSSLMAFRSSAYYIQKSATTNLNSLYRYYLSSGGSTLTTEEVVSGIDNMQIMYGVDTSPGDDVNNDGVDDGDGIVDGYYSADQIDYDTWEDAVAAGANRAWDRVLSVRIQLVFRSLNDNYWPENTKVTLLGVDYEDKVLRQLVTTTVQLRNRGLNVSSS